MPKVFSALVFVFVASTISAQELTQTLRGTISDKVSNNPIPGAVVIVLGTDPLKGATTLDDGSFKIEEVPVGKYSIRVSYLGYEEITLPGVLVTSGKEVVLTLSLNEEVEAMQAVEIVGNEDKKEALNSMTTVSTRTFSVEETQKFAAAVNDPGRMAISFAGVITGDDGGNLISVRGNSPYGLLWRMEGIDIPNPNHFANAASSGGGISILSAQTLSNSDFLTGAFPAEYGNALAAVFDLRLRKGNNEKKEYTFQAGFLGVDAAVEGPFRNGYEGSYLVNYRFSTLTLLHELGVDVGTGVTNFQDISYNFYLPTNKFGSFELFGFGGLSSTVDNAIRDTSEWEYDWQRYDSNFQSNTGAAGLKHIINLGERNYLQTSAMFSGSSNGYYQEKLGYDFSPQRDYEEKHTNTRVMVSTVLNQKLNAKSSIRSGVYVSNSGFNLFQELLNNDTHVFETQLDTRGSHYMLQAFSQWKYRWNKQWTLNNGVHLLYLPMNRTYAVEPRIAASYETRNHQLLSVGYGLHSQAQPAGVYKAQVIGEDGSYNQPNEQLGFNQAHHVVMGYRRPVTQHIYLKSEIYYQHLFNIAVGSDSASTLSTLNNVENYITEALNNNGKGKNYGLELTLEQFTYKDTYFLLSASLYNSKYKANDGVWRNKRFNGNYAVTFTAGRERPIGKPGKHKTVGMNTRIIYSGGLRQTPIDVQASMEQGYTQYVESLAYSEKNSDYLRMDVRLSIRRNRPKAATTLALDVQNATNRKNVFGSYFEVESGSVRTIYQVSLIPIVSYKVEF